MDFFDKKLSYKIKQLREESGISQEMLAEKLGVSRVAISSIENGERKVSAEEIKKIAQVFNISADILLSLTSDVTITLEKKSAKPVPGKSSIRINVPQKNIKKFKEVLLYILSKIGSKPNVGETVINKLLYFIDFDFYEKYEEQLMGANYIKNHHGPTSVEFKKITDQMIKDGELVKIENKYFDHDQKKYLPIRNPDLTILNARELRHIDDVLARLGDKNATELSAYSHEDVPWLVHNYNEMISYESVFYRGEKHSVKNYDDEL